MEYIRSIMSVTAITVKAKNVLGGEREERKDRENYY